MFIFRPKGFDIQTTHERGFFHEEPYCKMWLLMCFSTPFSYAVQGSMHTAKAGDILVNQPGDYLKHGASADLASGFVNDWIYIDGAEIGELITSLGIPVSTAIPNSNPKLITPFLEAIAFELLEKKHGYAEKISALIVSMLVEVSRVTTSPALSKHPAYPLFHALRTDLMNYPASSWTIEELSQRTGYSISRFCALYKQFFGTSPQNDIFNMRIMKAKNLLNHTNHSVTYIAEECGFCSVNHFSAAFKRATSYSPIQYRSSTMPCISKSSIT